MRRAVLGLMACLFVIPLVPISASAGSAGWTVYDYNPSGRALAPLTSPDSMPANTTDSTTSFQFISGTFTALLVTTDKSLTGARASTTLTDTVTWSGTGSFSDQNGGGCTPDNQSVRFYFESSSASGPSTGTPPTGFYTQFWWSNPVDVPLMGDKGTATITAPLTSSAAMGQWSDWNGQENTNPAVTEAFIEATQKVQTIGLSFGDGCFFEHGLTTGTNS